MARGGQDGSLLAALVLAACVGGCEAFVTFGLTLQSRFQAGSHVSRPGASVGGALTLVGAIGRGRGTPNEDIWQLGENQVEENKKKVKRSPSAARKAKSVVRPGEISPGQSTDADAGIQRIKENQPPKSDPVTFKPVGRLQPRKSMTEQEKKLYEMRVELSKQLLNKRAPPTAENLFYVPAWNLDEGGEVRRVGQKVGNNEEEEPLAKFDDDAPRKLKPPLEVLEMIKTLQAFLNQGRFLKEELGKNREGQIMIARIKLMRKHWLDWLEGGNEETAAIGRDPARHTQETRLEFIKDMEEAAGFGMSIKIPSDDECVESLTGVTSQGKEAREVRKIASIASKMANDLAAQYGQADAERIKVALDDIRKQNPLEEGYDADTHASVLAGLAVLEVYMERAEDAEAAELRDVAAESVSVDWVKGKGAMQMKTKQWEVKRPGEEGYGSAPAFGETMPTRNSDRSGWDDDWDDDVGYGPSSSSRYSDDRSLDSRYSGDMSSDWVRPGRERLSRPVTNDGSLQDGDEVMVKVIARTPLGFALIVNGKYDGLAYHSDVFQQPPEVGWEGTAWVSKARRDGKLDVSLRPPGAHRKIADGAARILFALENAGGVLAIGDRSDPDTVYETVGLSKKAFKDATGFMYRRRMVQLGDEEISLNPKEKWAEGAAEDMSKAPSRSQPQNSEGRRTGRFEGDGVGVDWVRPGSGSAQPQQRDAWPQQRGSREGGATWGSFVPSEVSVEESEEEDEEWSGVQLRDDSGDFEEARPKRSRSSVAVLNEWDREDIYEELEEEGLNIRDGDFFLAEGEDKDVVDLSLNDPEDDLDDEMDEFEPPTLDIGK